MGEIDIIHSPKKCVVGKNCEVKRRGVMVNFVVNNKGEHWFVCNYNLKNEIPIKFDTAEDASIVAEKLNEVFLEGKREGREEVACKLTNFLLND